MHQNVKDIEDFKYLNSELRLHHKELGENC